MTDYVVHVFHFFAVSTRPDSICHFSASPLGTYQFSVVVGGGGV